MTTKFDISVFFTTFPKLLQALPLTLVVGIGAMFFGLLLGTIIAILRHGKIPILDSILAAYISFFRGTPLMIQLFLFFFGMPQLFPAFAQLNAFESSIIIMSINASAYTAETIRSAIGSIDQLQFDASAAVGLTYPQTMAFIILPQALRVAIPPLGNTFIGVIQGTSLTFMLGLRDIMGTSKMLAAANYRFFETYLAVGLLYWIITIVIGQLNNYFEKTLTVGRTA